MNFSDEEVTGSSRATDAEKVKGSSHQSTHLNLSWNLDLVIWSRKP